MTPKNEIVITQGISTIEVAFVHLNEGGTIIRNDAFYSVNEVINQYKLRTIEINSTKDPDIKYLSGFNKKNSHLLIPVNEITSQYLAKFIISKTK